MRLIFGAPVALLAPFVGYMLTWIVAWIYNAAPGIAVQYWPPGMFCFNGGGPDIFCGRTPDDLAWFIFIGFFTCCLVGWEAMQILMPGVNDPSPAPGRKSTLALIRKGMAWSIVILPTVIMAPHIYSTLESVPGAWSNYGWGFETLLDAIRMWVVGATSMFLYGILRKSALND